MPALSLLGAVSQANPLVRRVGKTMPVVLDQTDYEHWLSAPVAELIELWRHFSQKRNWRTQRLLCLEMGKPDPRARCA